MSGLKHNQDPVLELSSKNDASKGNVSNRCIPVHLEGSRPPGLCSKSCMYHLESSARLRLDLYDQLNYVIVKDQDSSGNEYYHYYYYYY